MVEKLAKAATLTLEAILRALPKIIEKLEQSITKLFCKMFSRMQYSHLLNLPSLFFFHLFYHQNRSVIDRIVRLLLKG